MDEPRTLARRKRPTGIVTIPLAPPPIRENRVRMVAAFLRNAERCLKNRFSASQYLGVSITGDEWDAAVRACKRRPAEVKRKVIEVATDG